MFWLAAAFALDLTCPLLLLHPLRASTHRHGRRSERKRHLPVLLRPLLVRAFAMLLLHCVCASPDASSSAVFAYSSWIGRVFGLCVYETSALDIIGFICIAVHVITWALLVLPQLRRNYVHRSAANLSLLYLGFWLASEASFMAAIALER